MNGPDFGRLQPTNTNYTNDKGFFMLKFFKSLFARKSKKLSIEEAMKVISSLVALHDYEKLVFEVNGLSEEEARARLREWIEKSDDPMVKKLAEKV